MKTILLQGDSITFFHRTESELNKGSGYATMVAGELMLDYPGQFNVVNRGVGGDRIEHLYARMKRDILNLKPDYLTILIGVNDAWQNCGSSEADAGAERYRRVYCMLIEELLQARPEMKIYILEPYVLPGPNSDPEGFLKSLEQVRRNAESAKFVAEKYGLKFIPLQERFEQLQALTGPGYWFTDGVHPLPAGHQVIARALLDELKKDID